MAPRKRPWFRFYVEAVHDRKLRRLKPETRWLFVACLAAARQSPTPGLLLVGHTDPMGWEDLMDFAGMTRRQVESGMEALLEAGVVAYDRGAGTYYIPNWKDRQYESDDSTPRAAKARQKPVDATTMQRPINGDTGSDATPPENRDREQITEGETSVGTSTFSASAQPLPGRLSEPRHFVELVEPSGPVAIRREAHEVLTLADDLSEQRLLPKERATLREVVSDALRTGYDPTQLAEAIAASPFKTGPAVMGELRKRKQPQQRKQSVGDTGLHAAAEWIAQSEERPA